MKRHAGSGRPQGTLHKGPPPQRIYANHGGTTARQGQVHGAPQPRVYANHGGTSLPMGKLTKRT
jgi:hypothetical protein